MNANRRKPKSRVTTTTVVSNINTGRPKNKKKALVRKVVNAIETGLGGSKLNKIIPRSIIPRNETVADATRTLLAKGFAQDVGESVDKALQTVLYPTTGIHRGLAFGVDMTALAYIKNSIDVPFNGSTFPYVTFAFRPSLQASDGTLFASIRTASSGLGFGSPFSDPGASGTITPIAGAFQATNPSSTFRVVSFTLNIIASGALLTQAGEGAIAMPTDYNAISWGTTRSSIDNTVMVKAWSGRESMSIHWVPNEQDLAFDVSHTADAPNTAIVGYLQIPTSATAVSFRFEWQVGIEYTASNTYKSFVTRLPPELHPSTYYYLNKHVMERWASEFIIEYDEYMELLSKYRPKFAGLVGGASGFGAGVVSHAGQDGTIINPADKGNMAEQRKIEKIESKKQLRKVKGEEVKISDEGYGDKVINTIGDTMERLGKSISEVSSDVYEFLARDEPPMGVLSDVWDKLSAREQNNYLKFVGNLVDPNSKFKLPPSLAAVTPNPYALQYGGKN